MKLDRTEAGKPWDRTASQIDKPPLLSEQEIVGYSTKDCEYCELAVEVGKWARKVQREMDIKHYAKGVKDD